MSTECKVEVKGAAEVELCTIEVGDYFLRNGVVWQMRRNNRNDTRIIAKRVSSGALDEWTCKITPVIPVRLVSAVFEVTE